MGPAGLLALAVLLAAAAMAQSQDACSISAVFSRLTEIKSDEQCMAGCAGGSGECPPAWYPSGEDLCSAECGATFEPFVSSRHSPQRRVCFADRRLPGRSGISAATCSAKRAWAAWSRWGSSTTTVSRRCIRRARA